MSEPYRDDNLLDRLSGAATRQVHYDQEMRRERELLDRRLPLAGGDVLAVGCGWHPGRHLFPKPAFRMTGVDLDGGMISTLRESGELDDGMVGRAGQLPYEPESFDVVLYRLVLHHVVYQGPLAPLFAEAARLLRPGGALVAVEPGLWHPVGAGLEVANRFGLGPAVHGTPDDIPISPACSCSTRGWPASSPSCTRSRSAGGGSPLPRSGCSTRWTRRARDRVWRPSGTRSC